MIVLLTILLAASVITNIVLAIVIHKRNRSLRNSNWQLKWYTRLSR